jgi:hypothetical protein
LEEARLLGKEKLSIFCHTHEQTKLVKEKLPVCTGLFLYLTSSGSLYKFVFVTALLIRHA